MSHSTTEHQRLADSEARRADWKNWGPYVADRAWGTVREDYSPDGEVWKSFPFEQARSRAFRWNEDGIAGFCNRFQNVCLTLALWNEVDPILKERLFGLAGPQGNHGEDAKELWYHVDAVPSHAYQKLLYKYPQVEFPYERLVAENERRGFDEREFELWDAIGGDLAAGRYFDVFIEYAKADEEDVLCRITAINRGPDDAPLNLLPQVFYRNTWSWGHSVERPEMNEVACSPAGGVIETRGKHLGTRWWTARAHQPRSHALRGNAFPRRFASRTSSSATDNDDAEGHDAERRELRSHAERGNEGGGNEGGGLIAPTLLFTENDTNLELLFGQPNTAPYTKDGIGDAVVDWRPECVNPEQRGTKAAAQFRAVVPPGDEFVVEVRYSPTKHDDPFADFDAVLDRRVAEADEFHAALQPENASDDDRLIHRRALAGLLWSKQFYHYSVELWLDGDLAPPPPPPGRGDIRNGHWKHLYNLDVLSMPDKWEYPWYAAWDLAFHCVTLALVDPEWAKRQMVLLLREWYMHPNGQLPAYEWDFGDANPPVHAWAAWRVFQITKEATGVADHDFLEEVFHKLLLNFTWWVNRKDTGGQNVFEGGFLGLDNIGLFDRSQTTRFGGRLEQADGTGWMAMYCLNMLVIALELASLDDAYEPIATKFFEHFVYIAHAVNQPGAKGLWDEADGFYYDRMQCDGDRSTSLKVRSFVGLVPLFAVAVLEPHHLEKNPHFVRRAQWFLKYRRNLVKHLHPLDERGEGGRLMLSLIDRDKLARILPRLLDPTQFLADHGLRSLSRQHGSNPYELHLDGETFRVAYDPGESTSGLFGGNSNWRGPIWFPLNYLMIEALRSYDAYYGDTLTAELPRYSGEHVRLATVARDIGERLINLFRRRDDYRPFLGENHVLQTHEHWRDHVLFNEYFHGETGEGLGASHQTGWTALVANLIGECARPDEVKSTV